MIKAKIKHILTGMNYGIWEKENIMSLVLLAAISGESVFMLGPPGVAKSLIARRLKYAFTKSTVFEYLMSRFSTTDDVFGPVSISKLKNDDKYQRVTAGYLPQADIVFLDEIWKAGPAIQNALLTVINEKIYHNGDTDIKIPLKALLSASNDLPMRGEGLDALWDRFLLRLTVTGVTNDDKFKEMICDNVQKEIDTLDEKYKITNAEYNTWALAIDEVNVPQNILDLILAVKNIYIPSYNEKEENEKAPIYISDRRWKKIIRLLRTSAFLNERNSINVSDFFLLKHCLWSEKNEIEEIDRMIDDVLLNNAYIEENDFYNLRKELSDFHNAIMNQTSVITDLRHKVFVDLYGYYCFKQNDNSYYISKNDFEELSDIDKEVKLYNRSSLTTAYLKRNRSGEYRKGEGGFIKTAKPKDEKTIKLDLDAVPEKTALIHKGNDSWTVIVDGIKSLMITTIKGSRKKRTTKADTAKENLWDKKIANFKICLKEINEKLNKSIDADDKNTQSNLFVQAKDLSVIKSHIAKTRRKIEKIDIEILEIQNDYKKLQDDEVILN